MYLNTYKQWFQIYFSNFFKNTHIIIILFTLFNYDINHQCIFGYRYAVRILSFFKTMIKTKNTIRDYLGEAICIFFLDELGRKTRIRSFPLTGGGPLTVKNYNFLAISIKMTFIGTSRCKNSGSMTYA